MEDPKYEAFKRQMKEDIDYIKSNGNSSLKGRSDDYVFNYWILEKLYGMDEEIIQSYITDGPNDGHIDCWTHFEDSKELHIIQNKYYSKENCVQEKDISDFLEKAISILDEGEYKKSQELQEIYSKVINDLDYNIMLHFYITSDKGNKSCERKISEFNTEGKNNTRAKLSYFKDIYESYWGESFEDKKEFKFSITTKQSGTKLQILPEDYKLEGMSEAYYVMTSLKEIYEMSVEAKNKKYPLFDKNIREYLGRNTVNKKIIETLMNKNDRVNFFYYNNGITIICENVDRSDTGKTKLTLTKPQVVNGCQTLNTIYEVLKDYENSKSKEKVEEFDKFKKVFVMTKILVSNDKTKKEKPNFYKDIVKYTNSQTAVSSIHFGSKKDIFLRIQKELKKRGYLLLVKPSDKYKFINHYKNNTRELNDLKKKAKKYTSKVEIKIEETSDLFIELIKLLQLYISISKGTMANKEQKKILNINTVIHTRRFLLDPSKQIYNESLKIGNWLSYDSMIYLFLLCNPLPARGEINPYHLAGVIGYLIKVKDKNEKSVDNAIKELFALSTDDFEKVYNYVKIIVNLYKNSGPNGKLETDKFIIKPIDIESLDEIISAEDTRLKFDSDKEKERVIKKYIKAINRPLS